MKIAIDLEMLKLTNNSIADLEKLPFSYSLYLEIESKIRQKFNKIILRKDSNSDILLICYKVFIPLSNYIYWKAFESKAKDSGIEFVFGSKGNDFIQMFCSDHYVEPIEPKKPTEIRKIKTSIKNLIRNIQSINVKYFFRPVLIHNSVSNELAKALFPKNRRVFFSYSHWTIDESKIKSDYKFINELVNEVFQEFSQIAASYKIYPANNDIDLLKKIVSPRFALGLMTLIKIGKIKTTKFHSLLIDTPRNELNKAIALEFKRSGIPVYEFLHGHQHVLEWDYYAWAEFPFITHLLTKADNLEDLKILLRKYPTLVYPVPIVISNVEIKNPFIKTSIQEGGKYLMIGAPFKNFGVLSQASSLPEMQQYVIERRIVEYFIKSGKDVYYKAHPEGKYKGNLNYFWGSRLVNGLFEEIFDDFDGFLFYYTRSSVFPIALRTNKPIYIVDVGIEVYAPNTDNYLKQRCTFVKYDEII
ncbi:MAG: hypothetical protein PF484_00355 [Bacteroidales bacterium]|jgi:hypothetical protein|nr:hypothetical protein [Bacteroidales bacterium]